MNLTLTHLFAILPMIIVGATVVVVMLSVAWRRNHLLNATLSGIGLVLALLSVLWVGLSSTSLASSGMGFPTPVTPMLIVDGYSLFYTALILIGALACNIFAYSYLEGLKEHRDEFYLLLLSSTLGAIVLVSSIHMASLFVGLELMSVALYGMAAYTFKQRMSLEAGIKYMVLSAVASAFLLFGMALLYAAYGVLDFAGLGLRLVFNDSVDTWTLIGVGMMIIGLAFKLSIVPFHMWTSDVYEGAPAPVSTFLATVSKVGVFAVLLRFLLMVPASTTKLSVIIAIIAVLSMLVGNLLAMKQRNIKRLLAYSSIAHLGYLLSALVALHTANNNALSGHLVLETTGIYLVSYVLTSLGSFGVVSLCSSPYLGEEAGHINQLRGLYWRRPVLAVFMAFMMLSLAGIPLTAGFIGKFYVLALDMNAGLWWLVAGVIIGSAIGLYYYLRAMVSLFQPVSPNTVHPPKGKGQAIGCVAVGIAALLTLWIGVYPEPIIHLIQMSTPVGF